MNCILWRLIYRWALMMVALWSTAMILVLWCSPAILGPTVRRPAIRRPRRATRSLLRVTYGCDAVGGWRTVCMWLSATVPMLRLLWILVAGIMLLRRTSISVRILLVTLI